MEQNQQMCMGRQFQVDSAETEKVHVEMLLLMPIGLARTFVLLQRQYLDERLGISLRKIGRLGTMKCLSDKQAQFLDSAITSR